MVGVPGRSKACSTCKSRHVSCDLRHLTQAKCGQCTKAKRVCNVARKHIFVNHDDGTHKTVYRKTDRERNRDGRIGSEEQDTILNSSNFETANALHVGETSTILSQELPSVALVKQQFLANAQTAIAMHEQNREAFPHFWASAITSQALDSWASRNSPALACYTSWLGRQQGDRHLVEASRRLYVEGLREVQQSVNDPCTALLDETLSACIGLIIYEALECPDRSYSAYHKHIDGCSALIKLRGIHAHREGVGHELFRGFRYIGVGTSLAFVIKALQDHRPTYLVTRAWCEIPFSIHPKDLHDRLLDILGTGANFLGLSDRLATTPPDQIPAALLEIDDRCLELEAQLVELYTDFESQHQGPLFWSAVPIMSALDNDPAHDTDTNDLDVPLTFSTPETARFLTLYWAQQVLLRMGRAELRNALSGMAAAGMVQGQAERVNHSLCQPVHPMLEAAHLVLRSRQYCSSSQTVLLRYAVPLNITLDVLANKADLYSEEIKVAKEMKRQISQRYLRITQFTGTLKHVTDV